ncbi:MAG: 2-amino-4-hydroxy-6-hydroxymethyldihydropteridine diphosphokinase [Microbacteriaceae bacterium]
MSRPLPPAAAVVAIGANLGDTARAVADAVRALEALPLTGRVSASAAIETVAVRLDGPDPDAPRYRNAVALVETRLGPSVLLAELHRIEAEHGRVRRERWGDRTLDLDLIAYGDVRSAAPALLLPHPRAHERRFVLEPWLRVDPEARIPDRGTVAEALRRL